MARPPAQPPAARRPPGFHRLTQPNTQPAVQPAVRHSGSATRRELARSGTRGFRGCLSPRARARTCRGAGTAGEGKCAPHARRAAALRACGSRDHFSHTWKGSGALASPRGSIARQWLGWRWLTERNAGRGGQHPPSSAIYPCPRDETERSATQRNARIKRREDGGKQSVSPAQGRETAEPSETKPPRPPTYHLYARRARRHWSTLSAGGVAARAGAGHEPWPRPAAGTCRQRPRRRRRNPGAPPGGGRRAAVGGVRRCGRRGAGTGGGGGLRGGAVQEPALLRGAAVGAAAAQPAGAVARPLGAHRRAAAGGGPRRRLLRRRRPRQVRPAHGLHRHHALLGRHRVRGRRRRRRRVGARARGHQVGHRLLRQGAHRALRLLGRGGGRRHGPLLLAAARGHDDVAAGVPHRQGQPGLRPRRRDRRRARRRLHRLPPLQPALRAPPPPPRPAAVRVRRQVPGHVRQQHRGGAELLRVRQRVPRRAAVGGAVAAPRHRPRRVPPLRRRQGRVLRRRRVGHDRVQLGRQVRRRPGPRRQVAVGGRSAGPAAPRGAGEVQGEGGALPVRVPGPERRQRQRQRGAEPRWDAVRAPVEQPPVRLQRRLPPHRLLTLPLRLGVVGPPLPPRRGGAGRPAGAGSVAGRLHPGPQPARAELHGGLRPPVPGARAPPRRLHRRAQGQQPVHRVHAGVRRLVRAGPGQPQRARRRHRRRAQLPGRVPGRPRQLHADRGLHVQHRAHGRRLRQAPPAGHGGGGRGVREGGG